MMGNRAKLLRPVVCIAAMDLNRGIGINNALPWPTLSKDLEFLLTTIKEVKDEGKKNAVLYGRRTWESIPEKQRILYSHTVNVVISRTLSEVPPGADYVWPSLEAAIEMLSKPPFTETVEQIFNVGGSQLYKEALDSCFCKRLYLTHVMETFDADVFFPEFDENVYKLKSLSPGDHSAPPQGVFEENGIKFTFRVYETETNKAF